MTDNYIYSYSEEDVLEALRERILTKEVRKHFCEKELRLLIQAFALLTYSEEFIVSGKIYYKNDVRGIIADELDSSTVMDAFELFKTYYRLKGAKLLAWLILREHLSQDELAGLMVEYDYGRSA